MTRFRTIILLLVAAVVAILAWRYLSGPEIVNRQPSGTTIVAFGDSLTHGTGAAKGEDYPSQLSAMIGEPVINRGVPGETSSDGLRRIEEDVLKEDPRIVIVFFGGNDLLRRLPEEQTFANIESIIRQIQEHGALVVLVGVQGLLFSDNYNRHFRDLANETGSVLVPNVMKGIVNDPKLKSDQVHPNAEGYRIIAERVYKKLKPYLKE